MAVRNDFAAGEVLAAADLNDTFASKLDLAGGKILQIVRSTDTTTRTTTSTSPVDANISVTITPQKSDSSILLLNIFQAGSDTNAYLQTSITDASNNPIAGGEIMSHGDGSSLAQRSSGVLLAYATPATTSAVTYKLRFYANTGTASILNAQLTGQMYAIEVSA